MKPHLAFGVSAYLFVSLTAFSCGANATPLSETGEQPRWRAAQSVNRLGLDLYSHLSEKPGNIIYSPYSISTAMAMTGAGARGQTWEQMARVLHLINDIPDVAAGYHDLIQATNGQGRPRQFQLLTSNAFWPQQGFPMQAAYLDLVRSRFGGNSREINYSADPEKARQTINAWVAEQTRNKIPELFAPGMIRGNT